MLELLELLEHRVYKAFRVMLELLELLEHRVYKAFRVMLELLELLERLAAFGTAVRAIRPLALARLVIIT
jgi:hypothetical protein